MQIAPLRYGILEEKGVNTLNPLLQLFRCNGNRDSAELTLRDPQNGEITHVTIVNVNLEHDLQGGVIFFEGRTDSNMHINGHMRSQPDSEGVIWSATITL